MAFVTKTWKDRLVEYAGRRKLKNVATGEEILMDVSRSEGTVNQAGDAFSAANMNNLEQRIKTEFDSVNSSLEESKRFQITETEIGTWYDSKKIYRRILRINSFPEVGTYIGYPLGMTIDTIISVYGHVVDGYAIRPIGAGNKSLTVTLTPEKNVINLSVPTGLGKTFTYGEIVLEYTK